jgi:phage terminase large subunit-like protein
VRQDDGRTRYVIIDGEATWAGQSLAVCERQINEWGLSAFLSEAQHDVQEAGGGMFDHLDYRHCAHAAVPALVRTTVWCDPAVTDTDESDSHGIQADGIAADGTIYRLWSWEGRTSPEDALRRAILKALEFGSLTVGVETDQGGDTWRSVYARAVDALKAEKQIPGNPPRFVAAKAGQGHGPKAHRAAQMLPDYERGEIVHVAGTHETLERALRRFPRAKPFDLVDVCYWAWWDLRQPKRRPARWDGTVQYGT